jgi:hypothetical protein
VIRQAGGGHDPRTTPDHPALPARVSVLMLPDLGWKARFVEPHSASAVWGRTRDVATSRILLFGRPKRRWRSFVTLAPR